MPEKLTPEVRAKIIALRKQGKSFVQIEDELKVKRGALSHIGNRSWFVAAMKEKGEDGKTGYRLFSEARKAKLKGNRKARGDAKKENEKKEGKEEPPKRDGTDTTSKEGIEAEVDRQIKGSDKDKRRVKKKKEGDATGEGDGKVKKEKPKGKGGLLIVLILIIAAAVIIALFMIFGRKEKGKEPGEESGEEGKEKKEYDGRPFEDV